MNACPYLFLLHSSLHTGDTSIIGAGTYANDQTCAVSATGKGEEFMRAVAAYDCAGKSNTISYLTHDGIVFYYLICLFMFQT